MNRHEFLKTIIENKKNREYYSSSNKSKNNCNNNEKFRNFLVSAITHFKSNCLRIAIENIDKAISIESKNLRSLRFRGLCNFELGNYDEAIKDCEKVLEIDPKNKIIFFKSLCIFKLGKYDDAVKDVEKGLKFHSDYYGTFFKNGISEFLLEKFKPCIQEFESEIYTFDDLDKEKIVTNFSLHKKHRNYLKFEKNIFFERGVKHYELKEYKKALDNLKKAIAIEPFNPEIYHYLGHVFAELTFFYKGSNYLDDADYPDAMVDFKGKRFSYSEERSKKTLENYNKAISLNKYNAIYYHSRGLFYFDLCNGKKALKDFEKAISLDPSNHDFYEERGNLKEALGDYENANLDFNMAEKIKAEII